MYYSAVIKSAIWASIIFAFVMWMGTMFKSTERTNVHYESVQVLSLGQCSKYDCSFTFKDLNGTIQFGETREPVSIGQVVYRECWTTVKHGGRCYVQYSPSK